MNENNSNDKKIVMHFRNVRNLQEFIHVLEWNGTKKNLYRKKRKKACINHIIFLVIWISSYNFHNFHTSHELRSCEGVYTLIQQRCNFQFYIMDKGNRNRFFQRVQCLTLIPSHPNPAPESTWCGTNKELDLVHL